jgi:ABC-2 type transport system ATP-binding protein
MISTQNLSKTYKDGVKALNSVTLNIDKKLVSFIGRNGAGKTTLLRILSTQLKPSSGTASVAGFDIMKQPDKIRKKIVSIPQEASTLGVLTPIEHLKLYLIARGFSVLQANEEALKALRELEMYDARNKPSDTLSGGMKRKVFVAMALAANADITFLDEPTTGLDPVSRFEVWAAIKNLSGNIVLTTHYMEEAQELAEEVVLVESGEILEKGSVRNLLHKFEGKVRVESLKPDSGDYQIGRTYVKYVKQEDAEDYIRNGYNVRRITLDDLFVLRGVNLEP